MIKPRRKTFKTYQGEQHWRQILNEWSTSGKKVLTYCQEGKISISSFYQWRNRLMPDYPKRGKSSPKDKKKPLNTKLFVPIQMKAENNIKSKMMDNDFTLHYPNGCYLRLNGRIEPGVLIKLNQAMGV